MADVVSIVMGKRKRINGGENDETYHLEMEVDFEPGEMCVKDRGDVMDRILELADIVDDGVDYWYNKPAKSPKKNGNGKKANPNMKATEKQIMFAIDLADQTGEKADLLLKEIKYEERFGDEDVETEKIAELLGKMSSVEISDLINKLKGA